MKDYKEYFKGKNITVMGLGLLGRGLGYTKFLAECGANLTVTDLKPSTALKSSLKELRKYKNIKFVLGKHRLEDFRGKDMIIKSAGVPIDSPYIKEARKHRIPVEMDVTLLVKLAPKINLVGVTGTRGKSMTTALIYEIFKRNEKSLGKKVYLGGNIRGIATLPLLREIKEGDVLVCELDSWQLQGFGESKISPNIAVFTSFMPDHMNYYGGSMKKYFSDKANIFKFQKKEDTLIIRPHIKKIIPKGIKSKLVIADIKKVSNYTFNVPGVHQRENLACAVAVARLLKVNESGIKKAVKGFKGLEGRLQYLKQVRGVKIFNDNNATTPEATIAGIRALEQEKKGDKIVLIAGGNDKNLDLGLYVNVINTFCKALILIPGTGTTKLLKNYKIKVPYEETSGVKSAVNKAIKYSKKGDIILFSPSFSSFSQFNNEYERNDLFMKIVKGLK
ncbi:MAG: UDP-N-acetylmuramoylalanine--D-glutamate ligase [Patescibacteria group bacterium]|nr:UDP-N-acetylmuramoylalanine--D-glutamate ligase [Patescibacteria group bacterium]